MTTVEEVEMPPLKEEEIEDKKPNTTFTQEEEKPGRELYLGKENNFLLDITNAYLCRNVLMHIDLSLANQAFHIRTKLGGNKHTVEIQYAKKRGMQPVEIIDTFSFSFEKETKKSEWAKKLVKRFAHDFAIMLIIAINSLQKEAKAQITVLPYVEIKKHYAKMMSKVLGL